MTTTTTLSTTAALSQVSQGEAKHEPAEKYVQLVFVGYKHLEGIVKNMQTTLSAKAIKRTHSMFDIVKQGAGVLGFDEDEKSHIRCLELASKIFIFVGITHFSEAGRPQKLQEIACKGDLAGKYIVFGEGIERDPAVEKVALSAYKTPCFGMEDAKIHLLTSLTGLYISMTSTTNMSKAQQLLQIDDFMKGFFFTSGQQGLVNVLTRRPYRKGSPLPTYLNLLTKLNDVCRDYINHPTTDLSVLANFSPAIWSEFLKDLADLALTGCLPNLSEEEKKYTKDVLSNPSIKHITKFQTEVSRKKRDEIYAKTLLEFDIDLEMQIRAASI